MYIAKEILQRFIYIRNKCLSLLTWDLQSHPLRWVGSEVACKEAGKLSVEGKTYIMQDGDVMHFRFNVKRLSAASAGK